MADPCPECELCCALGVCCNPVAQKAALVTMFMREGSTEDEANRHATILVNARAKAQKK